MEFDEHMATNTGCDTASESDNNKLASGMPNEATPEALASKQWTQSFDEGEQNAAELDREKSLQERESALEIREMELRKQSVLVNGKDEALARREKEILDRELALSKNETVLKEQQAELERQRLQATEQLRNEQLAEKSAFEKKLADERVQAFAEMEIQLQECRRKFDASLAEREQEWLASVQTQMDGRKSTAEAEAREILRQAHERAEQKIAELTQDAADRSTQADRILQENDRKSKELAQRIEDLHAREDELEGMQQKLDREARRQQARREDLEEGEQNLQARIQAGLDSRVARLEQQLADKERALAEIRDDCRQLAAERDSIENFKVSIGDSPEIIRDRQKEMQREIDSLTEKLANRAPESLERDFQSLQKQNRQLEAELGDTQEKARNLEQKNRELALLEVKNIGLESRNQELISEVEELRSQAERYRQRIERLSVTEARLSDYEERVAEIRKGFLPSLIGAGLPNEQSEINWLQTISNQCTCYGVTFPRRILYAFHTALKISDWSSITVLAGVSGTGKSELPKLYAAFGGLNFIAVPVQPNWDSQESMLGFFNSIDNRFEPEDLLRFLVQCTEDKEYSQYMSIVLLDEMNLAHVEHYFADFLSKLESRRGSSRDDLPSVEVKLGAGVPPYRLPLARTIMWTGTMNQDETTKSLSDKVLDRGLVINFPRPKTLRSRENMPVLQQQIKQLNRPMLTKQAWSKWLVRTLNLEGDQRKEMERYRTIVEHINDELEHVGRALGHRVWQSVEYYMMNYPAVTSERGNLNAGEMSTELKKAMKVAFEDQIVQKIMPKLRGVETRGHAKTNLDAIEALLENEGFESLKDDFEIACEQGYGQFIWSSAKYIEADETSNDSVAPNMENGEPMVEEQG